MSHNWKMWVSISWAEGDLFSSVHLTREGAFIDSIETMLEIIDEGISLPDDFEHPGDLKKYDYDALVSIWSDMQEYFLGTRIDFDVQEVNVQA